MSGFVFSGESAYSKTVFFFFFYLAGRITGCKFIKNSAVLVAAKNKESLRLLKNIHLIVKQVKLLLCSFDLINVFLFSLFILLCFTFFFFNFPLSLILNSLIFFKLSRQPGKEKMVRTKKAVASPFNTVVYI